jgi:hypothetical protein
MKEMTAAQSEQNVEILKPFKLKRLVVGRGHDCGGLIADVFFRGKQVASYHDDGWGGEAEVHFTDKESEAKVKVYLEGKDYAQHMFDTGWDFMKSVDKIGFDSQFGNVVESIARNMEEEKAKKKIKTLTKKAIVYGNDFSYQETSWKGVKVLADILRYKGGLKALQDAYDKAVASGKTVFNDVKELQALGVKTK